MPETHNTTKDTPIPFVCPPAEADVLDTLVPSTVEPGADGCIVFPSTVAREGWSSTFDPSTVKSDGSETVLIPSFSLSEGCTPMMVPAGSPAEIAVLASETAMEEMANRRVKSEIVELPMTSAPDRPRLITVPEIVRAAAPGRMVASARRKPLGLAVKD